MQHPTAKIDEDVQIGPNVVVGPDAVIEKGNVVVEVLWTFVLYI